MMRSEIQPSFARSGDVLGDLSDLVQKEIRLARAEFTAKMTSGVQAGLWMIVAALLGLVATLLVIEAIVFALASFGLAIYWACLFGCRGACRMRSRGFCVWTFRRE